MAYFIIDYQYPYRCSFAHGPFSASPGNSHPITSPKNIAAYHTNFPAIVRGT